MTQRTKELFNQVYSLLVERAGAAESMRDDFVARMVMWTARNPYSSEEFRFMGGLGMGGKFWLTPESFHVSAYPEDIELRPHYKAVIEETNCGLKKLFVLPEETPEEATS